MGVIHKTGFRKQFSDSRGGRQGGGKGGHLCARVWLLAPAANCRQIFKRLLLLRSEIDCLSFLFLLVVRRYVCVHPRPPARRFVLAVRPSGVAWRGVAQGKHRSPLPLNCNPRRQRLHRRALAKVNKTKGRPGPRRRVATAGAAAAAGCSAMERPRSRG